MYANLKTELYAFYLHGDAERAKSFADKCFPIMDARFREGMTVLEQKMLQYDVITEEFEPVIFPHSPYFYETGVLTSLSDGARNAKNHTFLQANGWVYNRNQGIFFKDEALWQKRQAMAQEKLFLICGPYNDVSQHVNLNPRPFLQIGASGIYEKAQNELKNAKTSEEKEFLIAVCHGMKTLQRIAEKFAQKADEMISSQTDLECIENLKLIAHTAKRVPWEAPKTFYEALETLAFLRTVTGSLEGIGPNTFGRIDKDLISFYYKDVENGILTYDKAYGLVSKFLLTWDCHYSHDMIFSGYADHELENTYTLGGVDDNGDVLYNEVTKLFLRSTRENNIIFPKIKCRFSSNSPKEYFDEINQSIVNGTSTVLLQNDEASMPALRRAGRTEEEARDYILSGCWDFVSNQEKYDHGSYVNMLKPFEFAVHKMTDKCEKTGLNLEFFDDCDTFEEMYQRTVRNCEKLVVARLDVTKKGGNNFHKVDQFPIFSSTLENCIENHADYTANGAKYRDDFHLIFGLPNIIDSLLAIKTLVFDKKKYTLQQYLDAVRSNWENNEQMRLEATKCSGWGDGSDESCALANRFNNDLYSIYSKQTGSYGGKVHMGHLTYTEIRWWGEATKATPDGRRDGEYFAQGLTPSRLKKIPCVNDVVRSMASLDASTMGANSVLNVILPGHISLDRCEGFLRAVAKSAVQSLQLNCVSKQELLDAQVHPEKYPNLIVRVTGFSAKFTSLTKEWQQEVLTRNFYE